MPFGPGRGAVVDGLGGGKAGGEREDGEGGYYKDRP